MRQPTAVHQANWHGRLGNILWQAASTVGIARSRGLSPHLPPCDYRHVFSMPDEWFDPPPPSSVPVQMLARPLHSWARNYLQHLPFWEHCAPEIFQAFSLTPWAAEEVDRYTERCGSWFLPRPVCAVHVRRGDVLTNPPDTINVLPADYYKRAIECARAAGARSIAVFTDDREWCEANIPCDLVVAGDTRPDETYDLVGAVDWYDMAAMSRGSMHVVSNATYGVWAALLAHGLKPDAPVWRPDRWFGPRHSARHRRNVFTPPWQRVRADDA